MATLALEQLLQKLADYGVRLDVKGSQLSVKGDVKRLDNETKSQVKAAKDQIIAYILEAKAAQAKKADTIQLPPILPCQIDGDRPLSFAQQRLWFLDQINPQSSQYNVPVALKLKGDLNLAALTLALNGIVERHHILRTIYRANQDGEASQQVTPGVAFDLPLTDLSADAAQQQHLMALAQAESDLPFNLAEDMMLRAQVIKLSGQYHVLLVTLHHIASDGWSEGILISELAQLYNAYLQGADNPLPALEIQYGDYAAWQKAYLQGPVLNQQLDYWKQQLAGAPAVHGLPLDHPRAAVANYQGDMFEQCLPLSLQQSLNALAQQQGVTLFMLLNSAFACLISRYSNEQDIVIGSPIANREQAEVAPLVGFFVNTLVLRTDLSADPTFIALLAQSQQCLLAAYEHQQLPFEKLVDELQVERSLSHHPLFQVMMVLQNNQMDELPLTALQLSLFDQPWKLARFDLNLSVLETDQGMVLNWEYATGLFEASTIARFAASLDTLLRGIVANPEQTVSALPILPQAEQHQLLVQYNATEREYNSDICIHHWFEMQAQKNPDYPALTFEQQQLSYQQLNAQANRLAHYLLEQGIGPDVLVGLFIERSMAMIIAILAILKAGGAYVPLDSAYPLKRRSYIVKDSGVKLIITHSSCNDFITDEGLQTLDIDDPKLLQALPQYSEHNIGAKSLVDSDHLAYICYTSGSTGQPKGVLQCHRTMSNLVQAQVLQNTLDKPLRTLQFASIGFDVSIQELATAWYTGSTVVLISKDVRQDMALLAQTMVSEQIGRLFMAQAPLNLLAEEVGKQGLVLATLREIITGSEQVFISEYLSEFLHLHHQCCLWDQYGPTETHVSSAHLVVDYAIGALPPIGNTIGNLTSYVLDRHLRPVPVGVSGELLIGGMGLARGYLGQPTLTDDRFIQHQFADGTQARLYRTGDLVRWLPDGQLQYLGRMDKQVKIRGFRIELGEIESVIAGYPPVNDVIVLTQGEPKKLLSFVTGDRQSLQIDALQRYLKQELPDYMIPPTIVLLETFALTSNGKIDTDALPMPDINQQLADSYVPPTNAIETQLCQIWQTLLGLSQLGIEDNFFTIGGDSLSAVRLMAAIRQHYQVNIAVKEIFAHQTIAELAILVAHSQISVIPKVTPALPEAPIPLSFAQQRLWLLEQISPGSIQYNMPAALVLSGQLNVGALEGALNTLVQRHHILHTVYREDDQGNPYPIRLKEPRLQLQCQDLSALPAGPQSAKVSECAVQESQRAFNLAEDLMLRACLLRCSSTEAVLLITMHHIACDGWSEGILIDELSQLYRAYCQGNLHSLPALALQYADYASWQHDYLQGEVLARQLAYWQQRLVGAPVEQPLMLDKPRPALVDYRAGVVDHDISVELQKQLKQLAQRQGVTLFMLLNAAFATLLARYSGADDIVIGTPIANREQAEVADLVGFFVNTLVIRSDLSEDLSFIALLQQSKTRLLEAYEHQQLPFEKLVDELKLERHLSHHPLFQTMLVLQNNPATTADLTGLTLSPLADSDHRSDNNSATAKFDLTLTVIEGAGLHLEWLYASALFERQTIANMAEHFAVLLQSIVDNPALRVSQLPMLTEQNRQQVLGFSTPTVVAYGPEHVITRFDHQCQQTPDAVALIYQEEQLSYHQLACQVNQLSHYLKAQGVKPEVTVGLCFKRSIDMMVAVLAVLKAGGAYVPLDPDTPEARIEYIRQDAQLLLILGLGYQWPDQQTLALYRQSAPEAAPVSDDSLAYVIYTSGSTGKPKGVQITLGNLANYLSYVTAKLYHQLPNSVVSSSLCFDATVTQIFPPLLVGGSVTLLRQDNSELDQLQAIFTAASAPYVFDLTPSHLRALIALMGQSQCQVAHQLVIVGEALSWDLLNQFSDKVLPNGIFLNQYGPTETTVGCCEQWVTAQSDSQVSDQGVPIGIAIDNVKLMVLDANGALVPVGVVGELFIGGPGVARGYLNNAELSAKTFIADPFESQARIYASGDLVRWMADGRLQYLGRKDEQVKIRGFRVELAEISACLTDHHSVVSAVVNYQHEQLVAYIVLKAVKTTLSQAQIQRLTDFLAARLPSYFLPDSYMALAQLPLTANGKINKAALPVPEVDHRPVSAMDLPQTEVEQQLAQIWQHILGLPEVGLDDNFFQVGGDSLSGVRLVAAIRQQWAIDIGLKNIFEYQTVAKLAILVGQSQTSIIPKVTRALSKVPIPLSFAQQRLWLLEQISPGSIQYNMPAALVLSGQLNVGALEGTLDAIVQRHHILHTIYREDAQGHPYSKRLKGPRLQLQCQDLSTLPAGQQSTKVSECVRQESQRAFNLAEDLMLRACLLICSPTEAVLLVTMHHIASDGWSEGILIDELSQLYRAYCQGNAHSLPELTLQYADYASWQHHYLQGEVLERQLAYWQQRLAGAPVEHQLMLDKPRPALADHRAGVVDHDLPVELQAQLKQLAQRQGVTLFMLLNAAFATLLARYSGADDIVIGTPIANREQAEVADLVGFFVNTLVIRSDLAEDLPFIALLQQSKSRLLEAYEHQQLPFEKLVDELKLERHLSHNPLFQIMLVLQNNPAVAADLTGLTLSPLADSDHYSATAKFDLTLTVVEGAGLHLEWLYASALFERQTIANMAEHFAVLLQSIVDNPALRVSQLPMLTEQNRQQVLGFSTPTVVAYGPEHVITRFDHQCQQTPDAVALIYQEEQLSYHQLACQVNQLSHYLKAQGVKPEVTVGLCFKRSIDMMVAVLAVLKAGGAYVPLDPDTPEARIEYIRQDAQLLLILGLGYQWPDQQTLALYRQSAPEAAPVSDDSLAYVIYTSGSTGKPKGVQITLGNLANYLSYVTAKLYHQLPNSVVSSSLCFDATVTQIFPPLLVGGSVTLLRQDNSELDQLQAIFTAASAPYVFDLTPSHLRALIALMGQSQCQVAHQLVIVGEALSWDLLNQFSDKVLPNGIFLNQYGPTETTVGCCEQWVKAQSGSVSSVSDQGVPIGIAIDNVKLMVLDANGALVPVGVVGELFIGGPGVARGYLNNAELSAKTFIDDPFESKARIYASGDLVRWMADGRLQYLGRKDEQVKIRGFRVELAEIAACLTEYDSVSAAVVNYQAEQLVAYVVLDDIKTLTHAKIQRLEAFLAARLPSYFLPDSYMALAELPLTANGKVNKTALPLPDIQARREAAITLPKTAVEQQLGQIWQDILGLSEVGIDDNFFQVGGDSLSGVRLVAAIRQQWAIDIGLKNIFEYQTVAKLAILVGQSQTSMIPKVTRALSKAPIPLSFAQQRLWLLEQITPGSSRYHLPAALIVRGPLDIVALTQALTTIVERHQGLRMVYTTDNKGHAQQQLQPTGVFDLPLTDLTESAAEKQQLQMQHLVQLEAQQPFDLTTDKLLRAQLFTLAEQHYMLLVTMHHIASDGWSEAILVAELSQLYNAYCLGETNSLPPLALQYTDYAYWQQQYLQGERLQQLLDYWQHTLLGIELVHHLPLDHPRPAIADFAGAVVEQQFDKVLLQGLTALAERQEVTLFMLLNSAFSLLINRYCGQEDIVIGTPIANREQAEVANLVGFFVNTLVLRNDLSGEPSFNQLLNRSKQQLLAAYEHQQLPFEKLVDSLGVERSLSHNPIFQIMLVLHNNPVQPLSLSALTVSQAEVKGTSAKFDLTLSVTSGDGLIVDWEYASALFERQTIANMAEHFAVLLQSIVASPDQLISHLSLISEPTAVVQPEPVSANVDKSYCIVQLFETQVAQRPEAIALELADQQLSYGQLEIRANQLAHHLIAQGVRPETLVGLCVDRTIGMMVAMLAILKAGGAYVPLDPHYPAARLRYIIADAALDLVVGDLNSDLQADLAECGLQTVHLDEPVISSYPTSRPQVSGLNGQSLAYVIYTSGSTGQPKGVLIEHHNVVRLMRTTEAHFAFNAGDVSTLFHSCAFDFSVWEIWGALAYGGKLVIVPHWISRSTDDFYQLLFDKQVTILNQTPSAFNALMIADQQRQGQKALALRTIIFGGEALNLSALQPWFDRYGDDKPQLVNMYGITETTVHVTYKRLLRTEIAGGGSLIGEPLADLQLILLSPALQTVPQGAIGELYVAGAGLARGYLAQPALTEQRFIYHPRWPEQRLYRTGDLARYDIRGELVYMGRADDQLKLRGFRIEPGEIVAQMLQHPQISVAAVTPMGKNQRLTAYIVAEQSSDSGHLISSLRRQLQHSLPDYMQPAAYMVLPVLPLTANGKLDHQALPMPDISQQTQHDYMAPTSLLAQQLCDIWQTVLDLPRVGVNDNFFHLGGDSIRVVQMVTAAQALGFAFSVQQVFVYQTISALSEHVCQGEQAALLAPPLHLLADYKLADYDTGLEIDTDDIEDIYPLTAMQQMMLDQHHKADGGSIYHTHLIQDFTLDHVDVDIMTEVLNSLVNKHATLRTRFTRQNDGTLLQLVAKAAAFSPEIIDFSTLTDTSLTAAIDNMIADDFAQPFIIDQGLSAPLWRIRLLRYANDQAGREKWGLFIAMHHAIEDGWGMIEWLNSLFHGYMALANGQALAVSPLSNDPLSNNVFKQHLALELEASQSQTYLEVWQQLLANFTPMPAMVVVGEQRGIGAVEFSLDSKGLEHLNHCAKHHGCSVKVLALLAFTLALSQQFDCRTVTVDVVTNGRSERLSDPLGSFGLFWNMLPVCTTLKHHAKQDLQTLSRRLLSVDGHALYPVSAIGEYINPAVATWAAFNYINFHNIDSKIGTESALHTQVRHTSDHFHHAIKLVVSGGDDFSAVLEYDRRYFSLIQGEALMVAFSQQLQQLIMSNTHNN